MKLMPWTIACALLAASGAAQAQATASSELDGFVVTLHDLNTTDGIAPSATFSFVEGSVAGSYTVSGGSQVFFGHWGTLSVDSAAYHDDDYDLETAYDYAGAFRQGSYAQVDASPPALYSYGNTVSTVFLQITISAYTLVEFSFDASLYGTDDAEAYASLNLTAPSGEWIGRDDVHLRDAGYIDQTLSLAALNDAQAPGTFDLQVVTWGFAHATGVVPEPDAWALMSAGLLVLGGIVRRRKGSVALAA